MPRWSSRTGHGYVYVDVSLNSQSQGGNSSSVHYKLWFDADSGYGPSYDYEASYFIEIDPGNHRSEGGFDFAISTGGTQTIAEGNTTVAHDANGYCTLDVNSNVTAHAGSTIDGSYSPGGAWALPRIPKPAEAPPIPNMRTLTAHDASFWVDEPTEENGDDVYQVHYQVDQTSTFSSPFRDVTANEINGYDYGTVYGLVPGTDYYCRDQWRNVAGWSPWSPVRKFTALAEAAGAPTGLTASPTGGSTVALDWAAPAYAGGGTIESYTVQYSRDSTFSSPTTLTATGTALNVASLNRGTRYWFRVATRNEAGLSTWSAAVDTTTWNVPSAPTGLTVTPGATDADLSWTAPASTNGSAITGYEVQYSTSSVFSTATSVPASGTSVTVTGLKPGTAYYWRVRASNIVGDSGWSSSVTKRQRSGGQISDGVDWAPSQTYASDGAAFDLQIVQLSTGSGWKAGV